MKKSGISFAIMLLMLLHANSAFASSQITASREFVVILSIMPLFLFALLFLIIMVFTNWRELLHDILSDKEAHPVGKTIQPMVDRAGNHVHINGEPQTTTIDVYPKSASRLVLFCSSFAAILISLCMVSASIYGYFTEGEIPDFDKLLGVLLSLGIGVIPYMTNKIRKGGGDNTSNNDIVIPKVNYSRPTTSVVNTDENVTIPPTNPSTPK